MQGTLSESAPKVRRPLANGAIGFEDKYGVIHLDCSTEDENNDEVKVIDSAVDNHQQNGMREATVRILLPDSKSVKCSRTKSCFPNYSAPSTKSCTRSACGNIGGHESLSFTFENRLTFHQKTGREESSCIRSRFAVEM